MEMFISKFSFLHADCHADYRNEFACFCEENGKIQCENVLIHSRNELRRSQSSRVKGKIIVENAIMFCKNLELRCTEKREEDIKICILGYDYYSSNEN